MGQPLIAGFNFLTWASDGVSRQPVRTSFVGKMGETFFPVDPASTNTSSDKVLSKKTLLTSSWQID